jgi:peptidyl-prolyl cis-trans isomerase D
MRSDLTRDQATSALEQGFVLPDGYAQALFLYVTEKRAADYVVVSPDSVDAIAPPDDAVLAAYVKAHPERFSTPEYRQIEYATIGPQDLAGQVTVTDAMVAQDYAAHKTTYEIAEKRDIQQIEFPTEAEAKAARAKLDGGETFEKLADERKIKPADLVLGELAKSELPDAPRADAAFALKANEVSQPVKGAFGGFVLMRVTKIVPGVSHPLSEVSDTIKKNLALQMAGGKLADIMNAYEDARSGGADIASAAKKTGMKSGRFAAIDKNGMALAGEKPATLPADPEFLEQAFKVEPGEDNDPFAAKSGVYYAVKVDGVVQPKLKPLDLVRADAIASWTQEQKSAALAKKAAALTVQAQKDKSLDGIAMSLKVPVQHSPALTRDTSDTTFSAAMTGKVFGAPPDGIVMGPQAVGPNFIIALVSGISHAAPPPTDPTFQGGKQQLSAQAASDMTISFANAARLAQGVKVNQKMVQSAIGSGQ